MRHNAPFPSKNLPIAILSRVSRSVVSRHDHCTNCCTIRRNDSDQLVVDTGDGATIGVRHRRDLGPRQNLRSGVTSAHRYEPEFTRTCAEVATTARW
jgi:hypothetical protein